MGKVNCHITISEYLSPLMLLHVHDVGNYQCHQLPTVESPESNQQNGLCVHVSYTEFTAIKYTVDIYKFFFLQFLFPSLF